MNFGLDVQFLSLFLGFGFFDCENLDELVILWHKMLCFLNSLKRTKFCSNNF